MDIFRGYFEVSCIIRNMLEPKKLSHVAEKNKIHQFAILGFWIILLHLHLSYLAQFLLYENIMDHFRNQELSSNPSFLSHVNWSYHIGVYFI